MGFFADLIRDSRPRRRPAVGATTLRESSTRNEFREERSHTGEESPGPRGVVGPSPPDGATQSPSVSAVPGVVRSTPVEEEWRVETGKEHKADQQPERYGITQFTANKSDTEQSNLTEDDSPSSDGTQKSVIASSRGVSGQPAPSKRKSTAEPELTNGKSTTDRRPLDSTLSVPNSNAYGEQISGTGHVGTWRRWVRSETRPPGATTPTPEPSAEPAREAGERETPAAGPPPRPPGTPEADRRREVPERPSESEPAAPAEVAAPRDVAPKPSLREPALREPRPEVVESRAPIARQRDRPSERPQAPGPRVEIGTVEVVVQAPEPAPGRARDRSEPSHPIASRRYLRGL